MNANTNRQNILDFLRGKSREDLEEYALAHGINPAGLSTDQLDQAVTDEIHNKYAMFANKYATQGQNLGAMSPRTRKFTGGSTFGYNMGGVASPRRVGLSQNVGSPRRMSGYLSANAKSGQNGTGSQNLGGASPRGSQNLGGSQSSSKSRGNERFDQTGMNRWGNAYGSGVIPDAKDARGESPASLAWQERMRQQGMGKGLSAAEAAVVAKQSRSSQNLGRLSPRTSQNTGSARGSQNVGRLSPRRTSQNVSGTRGAQNLGARASQNIGTRAAQNLGRQQNANGKGKNGYNGAQSQNVSGSQNLGASRGGISPRVRTASGEFQIVGGSQNLGGSQVNFTDVTPEIDQLAQQIVQDISGGDMLQDLSQYTEAVRQLAGSRLSNGSGVSAVQATKALDPYYVGSTERGQSGSRSPRSRNANAKSKKSTQGGMHKVANQYGLIKYIPNDQDCRGDGECSGATSQNLGRAQNLGRSQNISRQNLGQQNANGKGKGGYNGSQSQNVGGRGLINNNWLSAVKACTDATDLNGPECAVVLDQYYHGKFERKESGQFRDAVLARAQAKLDASGQDIEQVMADQGIDLNAISTAKGGQNLGGAQNANGYNGTGGQNLGASQGSPRGARARQWLAKIKQCTDATNLNGPECAVALNDQYQATYESEPSGQFRSAVASRAQSKLGGQKLEDIISQNLGSGSQNIGSPRAQNTNGRKNY